MILAIGIWTKVDLYKYLELSSIYQPEAPYVLIGVGAVIVLIGSLGCCCTIKGHSFLLYMVRVTVTYAWSVRSSSSVFPQHIWSCDLEWFIHFGSFLNIQCLEKFFFPPQLFFFFSESCYCYTFSQRSSWISFTILMWYLQSFYGRVCPQRHLYLCPSMSVSYTNFNKQGSARLFYTK